MRIREILKVTHINILTFSSKSLSSVLNFELGTALFRGMGATFYRADEITYLSHPLFREITLLIEIIIARNVKR